MSNNACNIPAIIGAAFLRVLADSAIKWRDLPDAQQFIDRVAKEAVLGSAPHCTGMNCDEFLTWGEHAPDCELAPNKTPPIFNLIVKDGDWEGTFEEWKNRPRR